VVGIRGYFLGGFRYALGSGIEADAYQTVYLDKIRSVFENPMHSGSLPTWFTVISMLGLAISGINCFGTLLLRMCIVAVIILGVSIFIGQFEETRVIYPAITLLLLPVFVSAQRSYLRLQ